ncbi:MPP4 protein, partial [Thinocorus orbignyianus]|nr:MPP4 protein [Thinocorus orbignyianus]
RKQREFWWSQPFQPHLCLKSSMSGKKGLVSISRDTEIEAHTIQFNSKILFLDPHYNLRIVLTIPRKINTYAGFRRSMRLCRRKSRASQQSCHARCPSSCYSTLAAPYEEVVRYQRHPADRNRLIILVGPAGVGVNELRRRLIASNPREFQSAVPHTTRVQKSYEMNGREYHYVSKETFENMVYSHKMLEYGEYKGYLYGTSIDAVRTVLDEGKICVIDLEPQ